MLSAPVPASRSGGLPAHGSCPRLRREAQLQAPAQRPPGRTLPTSSRGGPGHLGVSSEGRWSHSRAGHLQSLPFQSATFDTVPARAFVGTQTLRETRCPPSRSEPVSPAPLVAPGVALTVLLTQGAGSSPHTPFWGALSPFPPAPCVSALMVCFPSRACLYSQGWLLSSEGTAVLPAKRPRGVVRAPPPRLGVCPRHARGARGLRRLGGRPGP